MLNLLSFENGFDNDDEDDGAAKIKACNNDVTKLKKKIFLHRKKIFISLLLSFLVFLIK